MTRGHTAQPQRPSQDRHHTDWLSLGIMMMIMIADAAIVGVTGVDRARACFFRLS